jgi:hypothetical protein
MKRNAWLATGLLLASLATGCVSQRYVITSDPPGALVYRNGQPIGATPVEEHFVYYGKYNFRLVKDGYEMLDIVQDIPAPWYEYPPLDFFAEQVWPHRIRDVQRFHYALEPLHAVRHDDVRQNGEALRARGKEIPTTPPAAKPGTPPPAATVLPNPEILPPRIPVVPPAVGSPANEPFGPGVGPATAIPPATSPPISAATPGSRPPVNP